MKTSPWIGGLAEWTEGNTAYLLVAFSWLRHDDLFDARHGLLI